MKSYYILLILLLSFSYSNAQSNASTIEATTPEVIVSKITDDHKLVATANNISNESLLIDVNKVEQTIARISDIRIYLNRKRNISNIGVLFPKINKIVKV